MNILLLFYNVLIRLITGLMPSKKCRKYLRKNYILQQICPSNNTLYLVTGRRKIKSLFFRYGFSVEIYGVNNVVEIDTSAIFNKVHLVIRGNNNKFYIGKDTTFVGDDKFFLYGDNSMIKIGEDCMFSYDVELWSGDGHAIFNNNDVKPVNYGKNIIIGNHVWVGAHSRILKGCIIPDNAIVGMSSVVTKQYSENNIILAGHPANIIKRNCNWQRCQPECIK